MKKSKKVASLSKFTSGKYDAKEEDWFLKDIKQVIKEPRCNGVKKISHYNALLETVALALGIFAMIFTIAMIIFMLLRQ